MPTKPAPACSHPGCPERTKGGAYCEKHTPVFRTEDSRGNSWTRGYDSRHRGWRKLVLHRQPVCAHCGRESSKVADHITPLAQGGGWSLENGQGLCQTCHNQKTQKERVTYGKTRTCTKG